MFVAATKHPVPVMPGTAKDGKDSIGSEPVEVEENAYYLRRIAAGELRKVKEKTGAKAGAQKDEAHA